MSNYVVWDIETCQADTSYCTILELAAIWLDHNFKEKERFKVRCRIPQDRVPSATALCINRSNYDLLTKTNLSHYNMLNMIQKKFQDWSPSVFLAYSGINFDSEVIRKEFFKSLKKPYIENTGGNLRSDALNIVRAAFAVDEKVLKSELNMKGNISMKLESLAKMNGFDSSNSHSAMTDTENTVKVLDLIKDKQPRLWLDYFKTSSKQQTENIIRKEKIITVVEYFYGKSRLYLCAPLHVNSFIHPVYMWSQVIDLRVDPEPLFKLSYQELKDEMKKTPKFLRTVRSNKAPIILDASYGMKADPYSAIDPELLRRRADLIKSNEKFAIDICNILKENAEEKMDTSPQLDIEPEESLYTGGFEMLNRDQHLFDKWHQAEWKTKLAMLDKFKDDRMVYFGLQIIYNETPDILPQDIYKKIKRKIAERILSKSKEKWITVYDCFNEIDNLREDDSKMFAFKSKEEKLEFLDGIDKYVMELEEKYLAA